MVRCAIRKTTAFLRLPNAKLSGGAAVRLSAGLERSGAVSDEHEKNPALALWPRSLAVIEAKRAMRKATIHFALRLMLPTQKLAKTNEGKRLPSPGTS